jgi:predicted dithiol-disulfide oxidoreductase (DUF899 family)
MSTTMTAIENPKVVSHQDWLEARTEFLAKEKEYTKVRDELSRQRRQLPWEKVEKKYIFDGPTGKESLGDLFGKQSQLIIYHFMLGPGWSEGCKSCSYLADHYDATTIHLAHRDVSFAVVSHAPIAEIEAFKKRMGWRFQWVSSFNNSFNYDYHVSFTPEELASKKVQYNYKEMAFPVEEAPGLSVFAKDANGDVFHTYSAFGRGLDIFIGTYNFLDHVPKGRDEEGLKHSMAWVRHHDKYTDNDVVDPTQGYIKPEVVQIKPAGSSCCSEKHSR